MRRPAPATVISLIALFFAMSGTAVAATGGNFLLGKSNTATTVTSLSNSKGTALSLSSTATTPPLTVSNGVQVPKLNASELGGTPASGFLAVNGTAANSSELGGQPASAYLGVNGTAANSNELGGVPASGYMQGGGAISGGRQSNLSQNTGFPILVASQDGDSEVEAHCGQVGPSGPLDELYVADPNGVSEVATWWNPGGVGQATLNGSNFNALLDGSSTGLNVVMLQVDTGSTIATYTLTENYDSTASTCSFTGQVVDSNG